MDTGAGLAGSFQYNTDLFKGDSIARMARHYRQILELVVAHPDRPLCELALLTEEERQQILVSWNETASAYPNDQCVHQLFERQAARTPDSLAVNAEDGWLTYRQLNTRANQLAVVLRAQGVGPEVLVGICTERRVALLIGLLGVLKAGGAHVGLDPSFPAERLSFMAVDAGLTVLLTQQSLAAILPEQGAHTIFLEAGPPISRLLARESGENPVCLAHPENAMYVIYTSGSTGRPKGVKIPIAPVIT